MTEVVITTSTASNLLPARADRERVAVLTQPGARLHAEKIAGVLKLEGMLVETIDLPDRDRAKTLGVVESVYETLARFGLGRHDTVMGVGGGSVTDVSGFVAGTWLRGVEAVHVPTTLLGAVDAAIGGKAGLNLAGKNLVGVFWHPTRVVIDLSILAALPPSLLKEGMAEALKAGLIDDSTLFEVIEARGSAASLEEVVTRAVGVKARIVDRDEREAGERAYLNLGHTIGHAIEFASQMSHGESVALGLVAAVRISEAKLGFAHAERVVQALEGLDLPTSIDGLDRARVIDLLGHDKKRDSGGLRMVLLSDIGKPEVSHVAETEVELGLSSVGL